MPNTWPKERRLLGTRVPRLDGPEKATGRAKYSFDVNRPGILHQRILRSPHAHAKAGTGLFDAGAEIVAVACDTEEHAADAIRAIAVKYEILDALVTEKDALAKDLKTVQPVGPQRDARNVKVAREDKSTDLDDAF